MTANEIVDSIKFPNDKFRISASRKRCIEYAATLKLLGMQDAKIAEMISTLYQDAFAEADYQRAGEKFDQAKHQPHKHG